MFGKSTKTFFGAVMATAIMALATTPVSAGTIRVSQESAAGVGDFNANVLGMIDPFATALTSAGFYDYGTPNGASYNGETNGGPAPVSGLTQVFLVDASDGLSLFVVHDRPNDTLGGNTQTRWNLGGGDTAAFLLLDDPGESSLVSMGGTQFDSTKAWVSCCTDGYVIGSLDGNWEMFGQFLTAPTGITSWSVINSDLSATSLVLAPGRRVRLDLVPEPGTLALFGLGLAGLGFARRKKVA